MASESDVIALKLVDAGITLNRWVEYSFNSHFLTPTDGWHFVVAGSDIPDEVKAALVPGGKVQLTINGQPQSTGYVDSVTISKDRSSGTEYHVEGRDVLSPAVDSNADPRVRFAKDQTLYDFVSTILGPFGFEVFATDDNANRGVITGQLRGTKTSKKGKVLKNVRLHQLKPYPGEGAFAFASRISQRHGLWIWPAADGTSLILDSPDFDMEPIAKLSRKKNGVANNILGGTVRRSIEEQPSIIVAQGFGGGGEFARARMTAIAVNPVVNVDVEPIINAYPEAVVVGTDYFAPPIQSHVARPMFLHDDESKTPEELANFVRREMSLRTRRSFEANYQVQGHTFVSSDGSPTPWCVNTMVYVDDDAADVHEGLWVQSRTFTKSRHSGTQTTIGLIRANTLVF